MKFGKNIFLLLKRTFFSRCVYCGTSSKNSLCDNCFERLKPYRGPACVKCGNILSNLTNGDVCGSCILDPSPFESVGFYGLYRGLLKELIISFKFNGHFSVLTILEKLLVSVYYKQNLISSPNLIVPVPIHVNKLRQRGFNQSLEVARYLAKVTNIPLACDLLIKKKDTPPQVGLSWKERSKNVKSAFHVNIRLTGEDVILIDDVYTSGSTLKECAKELKKAGANRIYAIVLARAHIEL